MANSGGNANNGLNDGGFYLNLNNAAANLNANISTHVCLLKKGFDRRTHNRTSR